MPTTVARKASKPLRAWSTTNDCFNAESQRPAIVTISFLTASYGVWDRARIDEFMRSAGLALTRLHQQQFGVVVGTVGSLGDSFWALKTGTVQGDENQPYVQLFCEGQVGLRNEVYVELAEKVDLTAIMGRLGLRNKIVLGPRPSGMGPGAVTWGLETVEGTGVQLAALLLSDPRVLHATVAPWSVE